MVTNEESSSGLRCSEGTLDRSWDFLDFFSTDGDRCDLPPTYMGILVEPEVWNAG